MKELNEYILVLSQAIESRENYQRILGKIASEVATNYGIGALYDLCKEVEEATGRRLPYNTLKNYRWVYQETSKYEFPDDFTFNVLQLLAPRNDIADIADRIKKEGLTNDDVYQIVKKPRKDRKEVVCPNCKCEFSISRQVTKKKKK